MRRVGLGIGLVWFTACAKAAPIVAAAAAPPMDEVLALAWVQASAEHEAATLTVYQSAHAALDRALADTTWSAALEQSDDFSALPPAIVVDVDETVLDNSPYQVRNLLDGKGFDKATWGAWVAEAHADEVRGAAAFLAAADARGVDVFYVSNREADQVEPTRANLAALGFPDTADAHTFLFRDGTSDKSARRTAVAATHRVVLVFGDNLFDFVESPKPDLTARLAMVHDHQAWWGTRWFLVPNPLYGSWDDAIGSYAHPDAATQHTHRIHALDARR